MAFGGYKFKGFRVDYSSSDSAFQRMMKIHSARVRSFIEASAAAGNPWDYDPDRKNGSYKFDAAYNNIGYTSNNEGEFHLMYGTDPQCHGIATFFKHSAEPVGYYLILTTNMWNSSTWENRQGIVLDSSYLLKSTLDSKIAPKGGSCFHCLSHSPFGSLPVGGAASSDLIPSAAMRLKSIGSNYYDENSSTKFMDIESGFCAAQLSCVFGYAVKDADIISICATGTNASNVNKHCEVMSLNGYSQKFLIDDEYGLFDIGMLNDIKSSYPSEIYSSSYAFDDNGQLCNSNGSEVCFNNTPNQMIILPEHRGYYIPSGASYNPVQGVTIAVDHNDMSTAPLDNNQFVKGATNPELLACDYTTTAPGLTAYDTFAGGNLMFLARVNMTSSSDYFPRVIRGGYSNATYGDYFRGYFNLYCGWDPSNPDVRTDSAFTVYNPTIS